MAVVNIDQPSYHHTRRASLLTSNRAFDSYKITDQTALRGAHLRRGSASKSRRACLMPDITLRRVFFISLWLAIQAIVLAYKWVTVGKEAGSFRGFTVATKACINTSYSAIFLFMSPTLLELLRRTFVSRYVVIEKNVHAHKVASYTLFFWSLAHVISYYYIFYGAAQGSKGAKSWGYFLFGIKVGQTGHAILFLFAILAMAAVPVVRRKFHEVFYVLHHLFIPITVLFFIHGGAESFQYYIAVPGAIYVADRMYRWMRSRFRHPKILSVIQHPSNVIELKIEKRKLNFEVGQYAYINVPSISLLEWHPFTLTSAPEEDELSMHIWIAGGWTRKLVSTLQDCAVATVAPAKQSVEEEEEEKPTVEKKKENTLRALADQELLMHHIRGEIDPASGLPKPGVDTQYNRERAPRESGSYRPWSRVGRNSVVLLDRLPPEADCRLSGSYQAPRVADSQPVLTLPKIMVDGPYGAPTQQVFDYEHVVLIAGGIGVTPMSSVLKSLYYQVTSMAPMRGKQRIKKVYFLWVCRDIQALEWFQDLLAALDEEDIGDILEIRTYLTGQLGIDQIRNIALYQDPNGPDAITGLYRSPTYYGRPNFNNILEDIGLRAPGAEIGVFFCGPKPMGRTLRKITRKWTGRFKHTGTRFIFHKENF